MRGKRAVVLGIIAVQVHQGALVVEEVHWRNWRDDLLVVRRLLRVKWTNLRMCDGFVVGAQRGLQGKKKRMGGLRSRGLLKDWRRRLLPERRRLLWQGLEETLQRKNLVEKSGHSCDLRWPGRLNEGKTALILRENLSKF